MFKNIFYPLQWLWRLFFFVNAILTYFLFFPFFIIFLTSQKLFPAVFRLKKIWGHFMVLIPGLFYSVERKSKIDSGRAYVFCPNHTSYLDIILTYLAIPVYFHSMGKAELRKVPLFKTFFNRMNISVNRKSVLDSHRAFMRAGSDIDKGISITLFPEGTIHHNGPVVGRFKNGPFRLAIEKQVPIVPITFMNNWILFPDNYKKRLGHPGIARIIIHKPIETKGMTEADLESLKQKVHEIISQPLMEKYPDYYKHESSSNNSSTKNINDV